MENVERPTEADWETYRRLAPAAVPRRGEQLATLIALLPADVRRVVDLGCGEGHLSAGILMCLPNVSVLALDGSEEMRKLAAVRLRDFGDRARIEGFDLEQSDWLALVDGADAVVSSLALHHLDGPGKERLFAELGRRVAPDGAVLIADIVEPQRPEALQLFADGWDRAAYHQSQETVGTSELYDLFVATEWNIYRWPDPVDRPSPVYFQLRMLERAGFSVVDCFWMNAGHAIYGGYKTNHAQGPATSFQNALAAAQEVLNEGS